MSNTFIPLDDLLEVLDLLEKLANEGAEGTFSLMYSEDVKRLIENVRNEYVESKGDCV